MELEMDALQHGRFGSMLFIQRIAVIVLQCSPSLQLYFFINQESVFIYKCSLNRERRLFEGFWLHPALNRAP